jgi:hypothetical protein
MLAFVKRLLLVTVVLVAVSTTITTFAQTATQYIYTQSHGEQTENPMYCSGYIDFSGVNSSYSTNNLYVELEEKQLFFNTTIVSVLLSPGTGSFSGTWYSILTNYHLPDNNMPLVINLEPQGLGTGCYGAGKLVN